MLCFFFFKAALLCICSLQMGGYVFIVFRQFVYMVDRQREACKKHYL